MFAGCELARADEGEQGSFQLVGLLFGDLYTIPSHHTTAGEGASGFVLRRGYLTANFALGESWYGRARIEVNQDGEFESYGFEADAKDLYLARKFGKHEFVMGLAPTLTHPHYATSKAGLIMFTRASALEFGRHGIRVNSVSPGPIPT